MQVNCASTPPTYTVGGTIVGLTGVGLSLLDVITSETLPVAAGAAQFTFTAGRSPGDPYDVILGDAHGGTFQPAGQYCEVFNGSGTVGLANVTSIGVNCSDAYSVGGVITGLDPGDLLMLRNANAPYGGYTTMLGNGSFLLDDPLVPVGATYDIQIDGGDPAGYTCQVTNGQDTMGGADVTNVVVSCTK